jgi:integrase
MPLKAFRRGDRWYIRGTVRGQSIYEAAGTTEREKAELLRAKRETELYEAAVLGARAPVSFQRAALSYLEIEPRSHQTLSHVRRLVDRFGVTMLAKLNNQEAADRAVDSIVGPAAAPATKNRVVLTPLLAILHHAADRQWCEPPRIKKRKVPKSETPFLMPADALRLVENAAPHLQPLLTFLLCTGARLTEALDLLWDDVHLQESKVVFRAVKSQRGRERDRVARLTPAAIATLAGLPQKTGKVFRRDDGEPYVDRERKEGGQIKRAWATACRRAGLLQPVYDDAGNGIGARPSVTPHDLRHTWASWFYAVTKDPLLLKDEGGWADLKMVERYAHLMPAELAADVRLVWGATHPRIGNLPRAPRVQRKEPSAKSA